MHDLAAGFSIPKNKVDSLLNYSNTKLKSEDFNSCYVVDYILDANESNLDELLITLAEKSEYFGNGISEITVVIKNIPLNNIFIMGADKTSIQISYNGINYIKFKDLNFIQEIQENKQKKLNVYGKISLNNWAGKINPQLFISDYELVQDLSKYDF